MDFHVVNLQENKGYIQNTQIKEKIKKLTALVFFILVSLKENIYVWFIKSTGLVLFFPRKS